MKEFKWLSTGSILEKKYLEKKLSEGYILDRKRGGFYYFETILQDPSSLKLILEYTSNDVNDEMQNMLMEFGVVHLSIKRLKNSSFSLLYMYCEEKMDAHFLLVDSAKNEQKYIKRKQDILSNMNPIISLCFAVIWAVMFLIIRKPSYVYYIPILLLFTFWIFIQWKNTRLNRRYDKLSLLTGDSRPFVGPGWLIGLEKMEQSPNIEKLKFMGEWNSPVVAKNGRDYYYRLQTNLSEEEIQENLVDILHISKDQIKIVPSTGLFPAFY